MATNLLLQQATLSTFLMSFYAILLSFLLATVIAFVYVQTFQGLSYSRNFLHSLILSPIVTCIAMQAVGDSLARGLGMMGAFSLLRFRSNLKDPRDMIFLFSCLAVGIACGVQAYSAAITGAIVFCLVVVLLFYSPLTFETNYDGLLRFNIPVTVQRNDNIQKILSEYCQNYALTTLRDMAQGDRLDYAYQIKLKRSVKSDLFVGELQKVSEIKGVSLLLQETTVEL